MQKKKKAAEQKPILPLTYFYDAKEGSTNNSRADPPWMTQPIPSTPPPPWEPPVDSWDGLPGNVSNHNATSQEWNLPSKTSERACSRTVQLNINGFQWKHQAAYVLFTASFVADPFSVPSEAVRKGPSPRTGSPTGKFIVVLLFSMCVCAFHTVANVGTHSLCCC